MQPSNVTISAPTTAPWVQVCNTRMVALAIAHLAKALLSAAVSYCCYVTLSPPNPPPDREGLDKYKIVSTSRWDMGPLKLGNFGKVLQVGRTSKLATNMNLH